MADRIYTVTDSIPENIPGFEQYSQNDRDLLNTFQINNIFNPQKNYVELHIFTLADELLESDADYTNYTQLQNAQSAGNTGASVLTIDPISDTNLYGYGNGGVKLLYHFINDLYTQDKSTTEFFIENISADRTELRLLPVTLQDSDLITYTAEIKSNLETQSYFDGFRLNFQNNDLFIAINIDTVDLNQGKAVVVKLYEPLPGAYGIKSRLNIVEIVSDSIAYEVDSVDTIEEIIQPTLRPANFNLDLSDESVIPTGYLSYNDLFSYPVNNTNNQLYSLVNEKGIELSIDHTDYSDFVHFSSAYERLANFKYKVQLIESYTADLTIVQAATSQSIGTTGSITYYENLITGILNNFDHYERFLYYQSSSYAWPKSNSIQPYINYPSTSSQAVSWYANQLTEALAFDRTNGNALVDAIPSYLKDDDSNLNYLTFVYMIGQHFDNLWVYGRAVTDKYDGDNRLDHGISKDLVGEALKNFGVKLYTSNKSIENLFASFIGQGYQSGSETITNYITGSVTGSGLPIEDVSFNDYTKEVQKRIYHNLPLILKAKGTERGVRALINCFGIPSDTLKIKLYGGRNTNERPFYGDYRYFTSSLDKVRLDNTGSIVTGSTISSHTSIIKRDAKYTDDLHKIEIGYSPVDNIDNLIISYSLATGSLSTFSIDDYIGDPRSLTSNSYGLLNASGSTITSLEQLTNQIMSSSAAYNVQDYVRLIKFFDNVIFKMVKDYVPARSVTDTGIIIKPHLLQRSKAKSPILSGSRPEHTGSIDTAFVESSDGDTFGAVVPYSTAYFDSIQTPNGITSINFLHGQEQPKYNGEFSGSGIDPTNGELNEDNPYKDLIIGGYDFGEILYVSSSNQICLLRTSSAGPIIISSSTFELTANYLFSFTRGATEYSTSSVANLTGSGTPGNPYSTPSTTLFPFNLSGYGNYDQFYISASSVDIIPQPCSAATLIRFATCSLELTTLGTTIVNVKQGTSVDPTDLTAWFNIHPLQTQVQYTASWNDGVTNYEVGIPNSEIEEYYFTQTVGTNVTIKVIDPYSTNCELSKTVFVGQCSYNTITTGSTFPGGERGLEFEFSEYAPICFPAEVLDPGEGVVGYDLLIDSQAPGNEVPAGILNGTLFNPAYGTPVDPCIGFKPKYLQVPRNIPTTFYGTPPPGYTINNSKDRGLQSYFTPYCPIPTQGLEIPSNIYYNVYVIMNDPGDTLVNNTSLGDNGRYVHTAANPEGADTYIAYLIYNEIDLSNPDLATNQSAFSSLLGAALVKPTYPSDIAGQGSPFPQLNPIYYVTPPLNFLGLVDPNGEQSITPFNEVGDIRAKLPVAYHIEGVTEGTLSCTQAVTIYPKYNGYMTALTPSSKLPGVSAPGFIFVNKTVFVETSQIAWGTPIGNVPSITVPIRKRG
jgi:hypothetical protein